MSFIDRFFFCICYGFQFLISSWLKFLFCLGLRNSHQKITPWSQRLLKQKNLHLNRIGIFIVPNPNLEDSDQQQILTGYETAIVLVFYLWFNSWSSIEDFVKKHRILHAVSALWTDHFLICQWLMKNLTGIFCYNYFLVFIMPSISRQNAKGDERRRKTDISCKLNSLWTFHSVFLSNI